jgi:hypothetical protein
LSHLYLLNNPRVRLSPSHSINPLGENRQRRQIGPEFPRPGKRASPRAGK